MASDFGDLRKKLIAETKQKVRQSVKKDNLIVQAVCSIDEADKAANMLSKRLREWYSFYLPEFSSSIASHEMFVDIIQKKSKKELLKEIKLAESESMGADIAKADVSAMLELAHLLSAMFEYKKLQAAYLESAMNEYCPNMTAIAGSLIAAKLLSIAGTLEKLSSFPASTLQMLGAEKALFRHLKTGSKSPKYGILHEHPLILHADKRDHGRIARLLADKLSIAAKVDYFKGSFVGGKLKEEIEKRLKK